MSTTSVKRDLATAITDARAFCDLFAGTYERWEVAGSVRRKKPEVGDIEHVVIPRPNFLARMDELTLDPDALFAKTDAPLTKAVYSDGTTRWGPLYRGVCFRGFRHEIFCAAPENWGAILAIRTGPADFSTRLVTRMKQWGIYRQQGGFVIEQATGAVVPVFSEVDFLALCGSTWIEPSVRGVIAS